MPFPEGPPPRDEIGAINQPRTLNRWLDVNPVHRLTRTRKYITLPAFTILADWLGYSDIVGAFNYEADNNFTLTSIDIPTSPNYIICVMWKESGVTYRYKLWEDVGEIFYFDVPLYTGQLIKANFRFEIWTVSPPAFSTFTLNNAATTAVNGTYTGTVGYSLWTGPGACFATYNNPGWEIWDGLNLVYSIPTSTADFPFGEWTLGTGSAPGPFTAVPVTITLSSDLRIYTSVLGNQDYMWADDSALVSATGSLITDFSLDLPTAVPLVFPTDSTPTTN